MTVESALALAFALFVFVSIPGPGVFATIARSLASGFRPAVGLVIGIVLGDLFFLIIAVLGMAAIGKILGELFYIIKLFGACYLIWMGVQLWMKKPQPLNQVDMGNEPTFVRNFIAGFTLTLGNPKVILFYLGFLPAFMDLSNLSSVDFVLVVTLVGFVVGTTLAAYAWIAAYARRFFTNLRAVRLLNRSAGVILFGTGVAIAAKR
ncbi:MAG: LysE family translocator [Deltaproteobacteria bacterium]|nr:LysE family translocator [Deltaproteobacteria bacterium]